MGLEPDLTILLSECSPMDKLVIVLVCTIPTQGKPGIPVRITVGLYRRPPPKLHLYRPLLYYTALLLYYIVIMSPQAGKRKIKLTERGSQLSELFKRRHTQGSNDSSTQDSNDSSTQDTNHSSSKLSSAHPSKYPGSPNADSVVPETPPDDDDDYDDVLRRLAAGPRLHSYVEDGNDDNDDEAAPESDDGATTCESEDSDVNDRSINDAPKVKFTAKYKAYSGDRVIKSSLSTREHTNKDLDQLELFSWAAHEVEKQLPVPVTYTSVTAFVYVTGQAKKEYVAETIFESDAQSWRRFLASLQLKKKERKAYRYRRAIIVEFELHLDVARQTQSQGRIQGQVSQDHETQPPRRSATQRQLDEMNDGVTEVQVMAGQYLLPLTRYWRCTLPGCPNLHNVCWVALRDGESLPGRTCYHYPVHNSAMTMWLAEIEKGDSTIELPSERILARLRQLRERSVNSRTTRAVQHP
jgi:hypothetical protein